MLWFTWQVIRCYITKKQVWSRMVGKLLSPARYKAARTFGQTFKLHPSSFSNHMNHYIYKVTSGGEKMMSHHFPITSHFHCSPISVTYRTDQNKTERFIMYSVPEARPELPSRSSADVHLFILQVREKAVICNGLFHPKQT